MSNYLLLNQANAIVPLPPKLIVRPISPSQQNNLQVLTSNPLDASLPITPPASQAFQLTVTGTGAVTAQAQIYGSNDGKNWVAIGAPITASGTNVGNVGASGTVPFAFFGALLTSITGTNATATLTMSC